MEAPRLIKIITTKNHRKNIIKETNAANQTKQSTLEMCVLQTAVEFNVLLKLFLFFVNIHFCISTITDYFGIYIFYQLF